ncbi:MAG: ATP-binding protein [Hamadaea sp.]|nr:ATP-binding protein [Hamadaea sp.]
MVPVLWLYGAPGAGKTSTASALHARLVADGVEAAYVDVDQLGMCYPEPPGDPERHRLKEANLAGIVAGFEAAGACCVVVSGVVDAATGVHLPNVTGCRLVVDREEHRRRYVGRGYRVEDVELALDEADKLANLPGFSVETSGLTVPEVVDRVLVVTGWPVTTAAKTRPPEPAVADKPGDVLWLSGATGVGKSTVGFPVFLRLLGAGQAAGYVDADQLALYAGGGHPLKARNLATVWRTYHAVGVRTLVVVGPIEDAAALEQYAVVLPNVRFTLVRLHAGRATLAERILRRGAGGGSWVQPGDPLLGRPAEDLKRIAEAAYVDAEALERSRLGHRVDTDGRAVAAIADAVCEVYARWGSRSG